ncbi:hypothetical protein ABTK17_19805, partial [Acinetobacter baumannii]
MSDSGDIRSIRIAKLEKMRELGYDPYANERFDRSYTVLQLLDRFESFQGRTVSLPGRVVSYRL